MDMRLSFTWHSKIFFFQEFSDWEKLMVRVDLKRLMWQDSTHLYLYISSLNLSPSLPSSLQYQYLVRLDQTLSDFRLKYCSVVHTKSVELVKIFILFIYENLQNYGWILRITRWIRVRDDCLAVSRIFAVTLSQNITNSGKNWLPHLSERRICWRTLNLMKNNWWVFLLLLESDLMEFADTRYGKQNFHSIRQFV